MNAAMFIAGAEAAAGPLFAEGARVGARIEAAVAASWAAVGCNTNLGIVLLCAPVAAALERVPRAATPAALRAAIEAELAALDVDDAHAAYRAILQARPGGLGAAPAQDVHDAPSIDLRSAMALAAHRDSIARQYVNGFADLFDSVKPPLYGFPHSAARDGAPTDAATRGAVQRLYLGFLSRLPDSHIVRKHGEAVAQTVMRAAQGWQAAAESGAELDALPAFAEWDAALKAQAINPGTSADLTVAALAIAGCLAPAGAAR